MQWNVENCLFIRLQTYQKFYEVLISWLVLKNTSSNMYTQPQSNCALEWIMGVYLSQSSSMAMKKGPEMKVVWINNIVSNFLSSHRWHKKNKIVLNPIVACADVFWLNLMSNVKIFFHSLVYFLQVLYYTIDKDPW